MIADSALEVPGADGVEILLMHGWGGLTRFAKSSIHQSTWREDTGIRVRVVTGGRVGVAALQLPPTHSNAPAMRAHSRWPPHKGEARCAKA